MILSATGKTFDLLQAFMLFDQSCFCLLNIYTTFDSRFASSPTQCFDARCELNVARALEGLIKVLVLVSSCCFYRRRWME